jgi:hypothetical protein
MTTVKVTSPAGLLDALATADDIEVPARRPMRNEEEEGEKR